MGLHGRVPADGHRHKPRPTFDLQSHSTYSDGALAPAEVVERAANAGVTLLALTDHDTVDGVPEALAAARVKNIELTPAVELSSVHDAYEDLHILGYDARPHRQHAARRAGGLPRRPRPPHLRDGRPAARARLRARRHRDPRARRARAPAPRRRAARAPGERRAPARGGHRRQERALPRLPRARAARLRRAARARPSPRRSTSSTPPAASPSGRTRTGT